MYLHLIVLIKMKLMGWKKKFSGKLNIRINRRLIVLILLLSLITSIYIMSIGGSETYKFGVKEPASNPRGTPGEYPVPSVNGSNYNITNLPEFNYTDSYPNIPTILPPPPPTNGSGTGDTGTGGGGIGAAPGRPAGGGEPPRRA